MASMISYPTTNSVFSDEKMRNVFSFILIQVMSLKFSFYVLQQKSFPEHRLLLKIYSVTIFLTFLDRNCFLFYKLEEKDFCVLKCYFKYNFPDIYFFKKILLWKKIFSWIWVLKQYYLIMKIYNIFIMHGAQIIVWASHCPH